ncbi:hypothetical protein B0H16DRAFT_1471202 [Mycena metata]|uniref:Uncharacterized protein n=1 Tax=Mycena metata TaxID=1033252 RepID=A0AAD7HS03_9AGAR|nr:hypothetical protein B0H16DRAFT_1471202 [Mycena metata]
MVRQKRRGLWTGQVMSRGRWLTYTQQEFERLVDTCAKDGVSLPTRREVDERYAEMQKWTKRVVTEAEVTAMVARKRFATARCSGIVQTRRYARYRVDMNVGG